jgi:hypothetical protein
MSRGQVSTLENLKSIIERLARYKMNCYMPYMEDIFQLKSYPSIGKGRGALTQDEVRELDRYARERYVDLIPIFQTLGHYENILLNPEFRELGEFPGAHTLAIANPDIYTFLENALREVADVFSSEYIHVGCDESWDVGRGATAKRVLDEGLHRVHADHYLKVYQIVKDLGRKPIMYGDLPLANPGIIDRIPKDITIVDWHYGDKKEWPSVQKFRQAGFPVIVSPGVSNWARLFPDFDLAEKNIKSLIDAGRKQGAVGAVTSNWGDYGGDNLRELVWYGYLFAAEMSWGDGKITAEKFRDKFFPRYFGADPPELRRAFQNLIGINDMASFWEFRSPPTVEIPDETRSGGHLRGRKLEGIMDSTLVDIETAAGSVRRNADQLDHWLFSARRGKWVARRLWMGEMARVLGYETKVFEIGVKDELMSYCERLGRDLPALKLEYESLWLRTNRMEGMAYNSSWYDYQKRTMDEQYERFNQANYEIEPLIESSWIAYPEIALPGRASHYKEVYYRHHFRRRGRIRRASLQIAGDSQVNVYLNGEHLGELIARPSLSGVVEAARVKIFDITDNVKRGDNVIAVSVRNYDRLRPGINVIGEYELPSGEVVPIGNDSGDWLVEINPGENWQSARYEDSGWRPAEIYSYKDSRGRDYGLSRPVLKEGIPSRFIRLSP